MAHESRLMAHAPMLVAQGSWLIMTKKNLALGPGLYALSPLVRSGTKLSGEVTSSLRESWGTQGFPKEPVTLQLERASKES